MRDDERLASDLLSIGAVTLSPDDPYTWASGLRSPVYCDNRRTLGYPDVRRRIRDGFSRTVETLPDRIAGTATAGIPHAAWLSEALDLPMVYVRSKPKGHGRGRQVEGPLESGDTVLLVEDLVSTGMSSLAAVRALASEGAVVSGVVAIFTYRLPSATAAFAEAGVPLTTLTDFPTLIRVARARGELTPSAAASLEEWYRDPEAWSNAFDVA